VQWLHLLSVGVWVGGLPWLLLILRRRPAEERSASAHLFSRIAAVTLATVAVTGLLRAISELGGVGAWRRLFDTSFGVTLCIKVALFVGLVALGARNHYVNVPRLRHDAGKVGPLRRSVRTEIVLAAAIFVATGFLSGLPPASSLAQTAGRASPPARLVVNGSDFATTVRIRLIVSPGTVGPNRFEAHVVDDDSGKPVPADEVALMFSNPSRPNLGTRRLSLAPAGSGDGVWAAQGMDLSLLGRWNISVLVDGSTSTVTVPLTLQTRVPPEHIMVQRASGQPTLYTISLPGRATVQTYIDPGTPGPDAVHFTFFKASGDEMRITKATSSSIDPTGAEAPAPLTRFDPGHFAANVRLSRGKWRFQIEATTAAGQSFSAYFDQQI